jgi:hypothetical protein
MGWKTGILSLASAAMLVSGCVTTTDTPALLANLSSAMKEGRFQEAVESADQILRRETDERIIAAVAADRCVAALHIRIDNSALEDCRAARTLNERLGDGPPFALPYMLYHISFRLAAADRYDEAISMAEEFERRYATSVDPRTRTYRKLSLLVRGMSYGGQGNIQEMMNMMDRLEQAGWPDPDLYRAVSRPEIYVLLPYVFRTLGFVALGETGRISAAIRSLERNRTHLATPYGQELSLIFVLCEGYALHLSGSSTEADKKIDMFLKGLKTHRERYQDRAAVSAEFTPLIKACGTPLLYGTLPDPVRQQLMTGAAGPDAFDTMLEHYANGNLREAETILSQISAALRSTRNPFAEAAAARLMLLQEIVFTPSGGRPRQRGLS